MNYESDINRQIQRPLETIAGLYAAAIQQREHADLAVHRVLESAERHGYTVQQVSAEAVRLTRKATEASQ